MRSMTSCSPAVVAFGDTGSGTWLPSRGLSMADPAASQPTRAEDHPVR
ncbi:hypothetical protein JMJ78_0014804, partial [Colletotrichum scovillei]